MGLFDFLKPKKKPLEEYMQQINNSLFPKGEKDIAAGTKELLFILNNKISYDTAQNIFLKSAALSIISKSFDKERLRSHLAGYCIEYFSESQLAKYHDYLVAINAARILHRRTPSEVQRDGETYFW